MLDLLEVVLKGLGENNRPRLQLIATIIAAIAYGFIICLFLQTLTLLIVNKKYSYTLTTRTVLIFYIVVMFVLSTGSAIQDIVFITSAAFTAITTSSNIIKMNEPVLLPLTIFGADGFMLWRCIVLYQNVSLLHRALLYAILSFISIGSLCSAIIYYMAPHVTAFALKSPFIPSIIAISITAFLNFLLTAIIVGRLLYHQGAMRLILGKQYRSPYLRVIIMVVESCSLIVVTGVTFLAFSAPGNAKGFNGYVIPLLLLPHIYVVSPLLVVYRVAKGRAITRTTVRLSQIVTPNINGEMDEGLSNLTPIQFYHSAIGTLSEQDITEVSELAQYTKPEILDGSQPLDIHNNYSPISPI